jgi:uncharacterized damage-inducible protein DinB
MSTAPVDLTELQYPIGQFHWSGRLTPAQRRECIDAIAAAPGHLREAVRGLNASQLATTYRAGGWTVAQVVHHVPDSHMNAYIRFKFAITEDKPAIKAYDEAAWAELADGRSTRIEHSLKLLECLHERWVELLQSFGEREWAAEYRHPEMGMVTLDRALALYAWHGQHHTAHITRLRSRMGWN